VLADGRKDQRRLSLAAVNSTEGEMLKVYTLTALKLKMGEKDVK